MSNNEKYRNLVDGLIKKSFPELKSSWIIVNYLDLHFLKHSATVFEFFIFKWIFVHKKAEKYSKGALVGMLAHELSHLVLIKNMGFFEMIFYFLKWSFSKRRRADFERKTDIETIRRGLGKERIELNEFSFKGKTKEQISKAYKKGYLSTKEIKFFMKKFRKF